MCVKAQIVIVDLSPSLVLCGCKQLNCTLQLFKTSYYRLLSITLLSGQPDMHN